MKAKNLMIIFVIAGFFGLSGQVFACQPGTAILTAEPEHVTLGNSVTLDSSEFLIIRRYA